MPAAVLVFVVLGAFCVDFAAIHLGQRELVTAAQGAANDAAATALDTEAFYLADGQIAIDRAAAWDAAVRSVALNMPEAEVVAVEVADGATVTVRVTARIETVFSKALPGGPDAIEVRARSTAHLR